MIQYGSFKVTKIQHFPSGYARSFWLRASSYRAGDVEGVHLQVKQHLALMNWQHISGLYRWEVAVPGVRTLGCRRPLGWTTHLAPSTPTGPSKRVQKQKWVTCLLTVTANQINLLSCISASFHCCLKSQLLNTHESWQGPVTSCSRLLLFW